ncbi:MAG TPA: NUDIX domain-containing protein [Bryobacteraceae bacterium]|nr:NUDIX domain-containing protein [Bryobacteraceae bacterium]
MVVRSAGLLMFRKRDGLEFLLVHPGGPFWAKKDLGAWSIPKGEYGAGADPLEAAFREFEEEIGVPPQPGGELLALGEVRQPGGKVVTAWAFEGNCDEASIRSNAFSMEWPKGSGRMREFPEVDRAAWFGLEEARKKILKGQVAFLDRVFDAIRPI